MADVCIQKTIEYNLKQLYPRAKIIGNIYHLTQVIGEEDDEDKNFLFKEPYIMPDMIDR